MKFLKKAVSILAACGIAIAAIPFSAIPADAAILYSLDDGFLTIKSPEVIEKDGTKVPWYDERDQITSLVLRDGITEIGDALFTDLTALETIDFPDTLTTIGTNSFRNCTSLKSIELPSSLTTIGIGAFGDCTQLQSVQFSEGLKSIETGAFHDCSELTEITLPGTLSELGDSAFYNCSSLASISIPAGVTELNELTFVGCTELEDITIEGELTYLGGNVFSATKWLANQPDWVIVQDKFLQAYQGTETDLVIPEGVTYICDRAFSGGEIKSVKLSDSVKTIGNSVFLSSTLETIDLNQVESIGNSAFYDCESLTSLNIPNTVTSIGSSLASGCTALTNITLGGSITTIPSNSFYDCSALEKVIIPDSVTTIERYAFYRCDSLEKIWIPESVVTMENGSVGNLGGSISEILTIYGKAGSTAETYATENGIAFVDISDTIIMGDVNNDGNITIADAVLLQKWLLSVPNTTLPNWKAADLCKDERLNVFDLCLLKQMLIEQ